MKFEVRNIYQDVEGYHLIDALPYIDTDYGQSETATAVKQLIEDEMKTFQPPDYLKDLPKYIESTNPLIQAEMKRIAAKQPMPKLDMKRYQLTEPSGVDANDLEAWKRAISAAEKGLEHASLRFLNLEMMVKNVGAQYTHQVSNSVKMDKEITRDVSVLKSEADAINKKRKLDQISCGNDLRNLAREYEQYSENNGHVLLAVSHLETEVALLKRQCMERGVLPSKYAEINTEDCIMAEDE